MTDEFSSFFTTGSRHERDGSYVMVNQVYVQQHAPSRELGLRPIVFIHGGGLTGAVWDATPDGRSGWAPRAVAKGWPVAVWDTVDSGRSARAPDELREGPEEWKTAAQIWTRYRIGAAEDWEARVPFEGQQFPVDDFDQLLAGHVSRRRNTVTVERGALAEVLHRLGPCHVIAHSSGAALVAGAFEDVQDNVLKVVLLEPLPFDPKPPLPANRVLLVWGDYFAKADEPRWNGMSETYGHSSASKLDLTAGGLPGVSHVMMMDQSSNLVLDKILEWLGSS
jgi:pimeloyl-ACP methyl ester carboxylesterase